MWRLTLILIFNYLKMMETWIRIFRNSRRFRVWRTVCLGSARRSASWFSAWSASPLALRRLLVAWILKWILSFIANDSLPTRLSIIAGGYIHPHALKAVLNIHLGLHDPQPDELLDILRLHLHNSLPPIKRYRVILNAVLLIWVLLTLVI